MASFHSIWPFDNLRLESPRLLLRPIQDGDIAGLVNATLAGIHEPDRMPFDMPWTRQEPEALARGTAQNIWLARANLTPGKWNVSFAVLQAGEVIGRQDVVATRFSELRTVETGSWLTRSRQGQGLGKEMRAAVLLWAFDHLHAEFALTAAMSWNQASQGVSLGLGYRPNGVDRKFTSPGEVQESTRYRLSREDFRRPDWQLEVSGHEAVAPLLGA